MERTAGRKKEKKKRIRQGVFLSLTFAWLAFLWFASWGPLPVQAASGTAQGSSERDRQGEQQEDSRSEEAEDGQTGQAEEEQTDGRENAEEAESQLDIDELTRELHGLEEDYEYPDFSAIFDALLDFRFTDALEEAGMWLLETLTYEISTSWVLMGELIGVIIFAAVFNNISSSFRQFAIGDSGFLISYFITFTIIFSNFTIMANLFSHTVETLSKLLKMLIPAYTLAVTLSGNLTVGVVFYEYFMIVVLVVNWICLTVVLPMIQYYLLL